MASIRPTRVGEEPVLQLIERLAGERFREVGLPEVADDEPEPVEVLAEFARDGRSWCAIDEADRPVGYVLVEVVDDGAHVAQVTVHPDHQGRGLGRALLDRVDAWAAERGIGVVTLTTFRTVPWNAPLYRHLGFRDLSDDELGPGLRAVRDAEADGGLDPAQRVCMRRDVG